jgi:heptosyltransferase-2
MRLHTAAPRTLVVAPNWVGDCVMAEPVFRALSASGRELVVLAKRPLHGLLGLFPGVVEAIDNRRDDATVAEIAGGGFDEAILLPNSFRAAWMLSRAGVPRRFGYRADFRGPLLAPAIPRPRDGFRVVRPQIEDYRELLAAMTVAPPPDWIPRLDLPPELVERGRERLGRARLLDGDGALVGLQPGAEWGGSKRWPMRYWADLALALRRRLPGVREAIFAGPKEIWLGVRDARGERQAPSRCSVRTSTSPASPRCWPQLDLLVTNDSGPMHLAAAVGVPCVALFGPTDRRRTAPAGGEAAGPRRPRHVTSGAPPASAAAARSSTTAACAASASTRSPTPSSAGFRRTDRRHFRGRNWQRGDGRRGTDGSAPRRRQDDDDVLGPHQAQARAGHAVEGYRVVLQTLDAPLEPRDALLGAGDLGGQQALPTAHRREIAVALQAEGGEQQHQEDHHRDQDRAQRDAGAARPLERVASGGVASSAESRERGGARDRSPPRPAPPRCAGVGCTWPPGRCGRARRS